MDIGFSQEPWILIQMGTGLPLEKLCFRAPVVTRVNIISGGTPRTLMLCSVFRPSESSMLLPSAELIVVIDFRRLGDELSS